MGNILFSSAFALILLACNKEEKSNEANILDYSVTNSNIESFKLDEVIINESEN